MNRKGIKMPYCIKCGTELESDSRFCSMCGKMIGNRVTSEKEQDHKSLTEKDNMRTRQDDTIIEAPRTKALYIEGQQRTPVLTTEAQPTTPSAGLAEGYRRSERMTMISANEELNDYILKGGGISRIGLNMSKIKIIAVLIVIACPFFIYSLISSIPELPESLRSVDGPSRDLLSTSGVFRPGGYISFKMTPGISSIEEYYKATVEIIPVLDNRQLQDGLSWPSIQDEVGLDWGSTFVSGPSGMIHSGEFVIETRMDIPNDPLLSGERILILLMYEITYPDYTGHGGFANYKRKIRQEIEVTIGDEPITSEEKKLEEQNDRLTNFLVIVVGVLFCIWILCIVFLGKNGKKGRKW